MNRGWFRRFFEQDYFRKTPEQIDTSIDEAIPQVEFLIDALELNTTDRILDLCCGYGRHAINFAKTGYNITGFDFCEKVLELVRQKAKRDGIKVHLVRGDMRALPFKNAFDAIYNYFTSFGYFEDDSDDLKVLKGVERTLKSEGKFLIDYVNGALILKRFMDRFCEEGPDRDILHECTYDKETKRLRTKWTFIYKDTGESNEYSVAQRLYSPEELASALNSVGLRTLNCYGDRQKSEYNEDSKRIIIVAQKI